MFLTLTNMRYEGLIPDHTLHEGQLWAEDKWDKPGGTGFSPDQKFLAGNRKISIVTVFVNKKWEAIAYWMVEEGTGNQPFFKTWEEIKSAIDNFKLRPI
jgi:hypothetical protein